MHCCSASFPRTPLSADGPQLVTFEGVISHKGRFGHMGAYPRAFVLTAVHAAQAMANPDTACD